MVVPRVFIGIRKFSETIEVCEGIGEKVDRMAIGEDMLRHKAGGLWAPGPYWGDSRMIGGPRVAYMLGS